MAYNLLDLQSAVIDDLKDPAFSSSRVIRYLNRAQLAIFNTHTFRFTEKAVSGPLTVGEYTYDQQSDHQATIGGVLVDPVDDTLRYTLTDDLTYLPHREFFEQFPDPSTETASRPTYWTEFGDQIYFNCPVDKAYVFTQRYFRVPTELTAPTDVPDAPAAFRELLELYALYRSEKYRQNHDVAATYKQDFEDGLESMALRFSSVTAVAPTTMRQTRVRVGD